MMNVAAWNANVSGLESPASVSRSEWNMPGVEVKHTVWTMSAPAPYFSIMGTIDLDTRFFVGPNGFLHDYAITAALDSPELPQGVDWNSEGHAPRNPYSFIFISPRITIDKHFSCVNFEIRIPTNPAWYPRPGDSRSFILRVKAFGTQQTNLVTEVNETSFVILNKVGQAQGGIVSQRRNSSWAL